MPARKAKIRYTAVPKRFVRPKRLFWLAIGAGAMAAGVSLGVAMVSGATIGSYRSFSGTLRPEVDPLPIYLLEGAILEKVLIAPGDTIVQGQTLATLDKAAMSAAVKELQAGLLHHTVLRDCLLSTQKPGTPDIKGVTEDQQTAVSLAVQECSGFTDDRVEVHVRFDTHRDALLSKRKLVEDYIRVLTTTKDNQDKVRREDDARRALALALVRADLDSQLAENELEQRAELSGLRSKRLDRVQQLEQEIQGKRNLQKILKLHMDTPRIAAPFDGEIVRVRNLVQTGPAQTDINLIQMRPPESDQFQAYFDVPQSQINGITLGRPVSVKIVGQLETHRSLQGEITDLQALGANDIRISVALDSESQLHLLELSDRLALFGRATATQVKVRLGDLPIWETMMQSTISVRRGDSDNDPMLDVGKAARVTDIQPVEEG